MRYLNIRKIKQHWPSGHTNQDLQFLIPTGLLLLKINPYNRQVSNISIVYTGPYGHV